MIKLLLLIVSVLFCIDVAGQVSVFGYISSFDSPGENLEIKVPDNDAIWHMPEPSIGNRDFLNEVKSRVSTEEVSKMLLSRSIEFTFKVDDKGNTSDLGYDFNINQGYGSNEDSKDYSYLLPLDGKWFPMIRNGKAIDSKLKLVLFRNEAVAEGDIVVSVGYMMDKGETFEWREIMYYQYAKK